MSGLGLADAGRWDNLGRYEEALISCDKVIELGSQHSSVFFNRAIAILGLNRWDEGITTFRRRIPTPRTRG